MTTERLAREHVEPTNPPDVRRWKHQQGDAYQVIIARAWMNERGSGITYHPQPRWHTRLYSAIREGFAEYDRSDDFNVGVWRDGDLVAMLWMDEVTDDDPAVVAEIAAQWAT